MSVWEVILKFRKLYPTERGLKSMLASEKFEK